MPINPINQRIFTTMKEQNKTQASLAAYIDVAPNTVTSWNRGLSTPSIDKISGIADFLGVTLDFLIRGHAPSQTQKENQPTQNVQADKNVSKPIIKMPLIAQPYPIYPSRQLIAYVDILGTKEMSRRNGILFANLLKETYDNFQNNLKISGINSNIQMKCFSDNIAFSCDYNEKTAIIEISNMISLLISFQLDLLRHKVVCRGSLGIGQIYIDNAFVMGNGLIDNYYIENDKALYPRIIISKEIIDIINQHSPIERRNGVYCKDFDGYYYVNFLLEATKSDYEILDNVIKANLEDKPTESVAKKYFWLKNYANNLQKGQSKGFGDYLVEHKDDLMKIATTDKKAIAAEFAKTYEELIHEKCYNDITKLYQKLEDAARKAVLLFILNYYNNNGVDTYPIVGYRLGD